MDKEQEKLLDAWLPLVKVNQINEKSVRIIEENNMPVHLQKGEFSFWTILYLLSPSDVPNEPIENLNNSKCDWLGRTSSN